MFYLQFLNIVYTFMIIVSKDMKIYSLESAYDIKPFLPNDPIRFLLLTIQKSGSHYFRDVLNQHPDVLLQNEVCIKFTNHAMNHSFTCSDLLLFSLGLIEDPLPVILQEHLYNEKHFHTLHSEMKDKKAIGALVHANQGWKENEDIMNLMKLIYNKKKYSHNNNHNNIKTNEQIIKIIFLHRKNYIALSLATQNTIVRNPEVNVPEIVHINNTRKFLKLSIINEQIYGRFIKEVDDYLYITYERATSDFSLFLNVFHYIGIDNLLISESNKNEIINLNNNNIHIKINTSERHHNLLPIDYISNQEEVKYQLRDLNNFYCMLYNNCTWFSSYCIDPLRCFY